LSRAFALRHELLQRTPSLLRENCCMPCIDFDLEMKIMRAPSMPETPFIPAESWHLLPTSLGLT
jgi:hypothetical protein